MDDLTPRQEKALAALITEVTIEAAAEKAGVSDVTIWRWLKEVTFQRHYLYARRQAVEDAVGLLQRASKRAVATLVKSLDCGQPAAEIRAAQVILEQSLRGVEVLELEARIAMLEQSLSELPKDAAKGRNGARH